jgi:hypothetical protein
VTDAFPSLGWFKRYAAFLEKDFDFTKHGRWLTTSIAFRIDQSTVVMKLDRGIVLDLHEGFEETEFLISGTSEQWSYLFDKGWGFIRLYRAQILAVRGDIVRLMQNLSAIFFVVEAMKRYDLSVRAKA